MFKPDERYLPVKPGTYQTKESVEYLFSKVSNTREHWQKIVDKLKGIYCWSDDLQTSWFEINMQGTIEFHGEGCRYIRGGEIGVQPHGLYNLWGIGERAPEWAQEKFLLHPFTFESRLDGSPSPWSFVQDESGVVSLKYTAPNIVNWLRNLPGIYFTDNVEKGGNRYEWDRGRDAIPKETFDRETLPKDRKYSFGHFITGDGKLEKGYEFHFMNQNQDGSWNLASYDSALITIDNPFNFTMPRIDLDNAFYNSTAIPGVVPYEFYWKEPEAARLEALKNKVREGYRNAVASIENKYRLQFNSHETNFPEKFTVKLTTPVFRLAGLHPGEYDIMAEGDSAFRYTLTMPESKSHSHFIGEKFNDTKIRKHTATMDTPAKVLEHYKAQRLYFRVKLTHKETGLESDWIDVQYSPITKWEKDSVYDLTDEIMARENQWNVQLYAVRNIVDVNKDGSPVYKLLNQFVINNFGHPGTYKIKTDFNDQPQTSQDHIALNYDKHFSQLTPSQREHWNQIKYKLIEYTHPNGQGPYPFYMDEKTFTAQSSDTATYAIKSELFPNPRYWITGDMVKTTYPDRRVEKSFSNVQFHLSGHKQGRWNINVRGLYSGDIDVGRNGETVINLTNLTTDMITLLSNENNRSTFVDINTWNGVEIRPWLSRFPDVNVIGTAEALFEFNATEKQGEDSVITRLRNALNNVTLDSIKRLDFLQYMTRARPTYEVTLPSTLPAGNYKFRLGSPEIRPIGAVTITSNGNTNKLSVTNAENILENLYMSGTKLSLIEYNGSAIDNITSTVNFRETRRYLKAALKPLTDSMEITGRLTITGNGDYEQDLRLESDANDSEFNQYYRLNIDNLGDEVYEAIAGGVINDGVFRGSFTDQAKPIIRTWDPKTKPTIPVRMLGINLSSADYYDLYEDEAAMNANRPGFTVQVPNRITYTNNQAIIDEAKAIMETLKSKKVFVLQLLEDFDNDERARFEQRIYVPKLRNEEDRNIQVRVVGESNTFRLPLTDKPFTMQDHPWVDKPNTPTSEYTLAKLTNVSLELISIDGVAIPDTPRYDIGVSLCDQYIKRSALLNRVENMDLDGKIVLRGSQSDYTAKLSGTLGKTSYSKLPTGDYDVVFRINGQMVKTSPVVKHDMASSLGSFTNILLPPDTTVERLPKTIEGNIIHYRGLRVRHDTSVEIAAVPITLNNRLTMDDQRRGG